MCNQRQWRADAPELLQERLPAAWAPHDEAATFCVLLGCSIGVDGTPLPPPPTPS